MSDARGLTKLLPTSSADIVKVKLLGQLDVRCVMHILKRGKESAEGKDYPNLTAIAEVRRQ